MTFGAESVIGGENVDVGNESVGVPVADAGMAVGLSGVSNVTGSVGKSADDAVDNVEKKQATETPLSDAALSYLEVFVIGLGEDNINDETNDQDDKKKNKR